MTRALGLALLWFAAVPAARMDGRPTAPTGQVVFFDDFDAATVNRSSWNVIVTGRTVNDEQQAYIDSNDTIALVAGAAAEGAERGALRITARSTPGFKTSEGRSFDFTSGRLDTRGKVEFSYGTVSARIKMTAGTGLWPAFWVLGADRWPDTGEMDIMENVGDPSWTNVALHGPGYSGNTPLVKRRAFPAGTDSTSWHVYSMDWTPDGLAFSVDDDVFYRVSKADVEVHGRWAYDTPKHIIVNLALGGGYPQAVNQLEKPYPGLAESTVALIKRDEARLLVDWVRVVGR